MGRDIRGQTLVPVVETFRLECVAHIETSTTSLFIITSTGVRGSHMLTVPSWRRRGEVTHLLLQRGCPREERASLAAPHAGGEQPALE